MNWQTDHRSWNYNENHFNPLNQHSAAFSIFRLISKHSWMWQPLSYNFIIFVWQTLMHDVLWEGSLYPPSLSPLPSSALQGTQAYYLLLFVSLGKGRIFLCDNFYNWINIKNNCIWFSVPSWCLPEEPMEYSGFCHCDYWVWLHMSVKY